LWLLRNYIHHYHVPLEHLLAFAFFYFLANKTIKDQTKMKNGKWTVTYRPFFGILFLSLLTPVEQEIGRSTHYASYAITTCNKHHMQAFKELCTWDNRNMCWLWWWNSARLRRPWWIITTSPLTTGNSPTSGFHVKDIYIQHGVIFMSKKLRNILIYTNHSFFDFMVTTLRVLCYFRILLTRLLMIRVKESN
jgi:hypothetical protein